MLPAVHKGMEQAAGIVQISPDVGAALFQLLEPLFFRKSDEIPYCIIIAGKFLKSCVRASLFHDSVPIILSVLPA